MARIVRRDEGPFAAAIDQGPVLDGPERMVMATEAVEEIEDGSRKRIP